jgi:phosphate transport system substrate-binding protein
MASKNEMQKLGLSLLITLGLLGLGAWFFISKIAWQSPQSSIAISNSVANPVKRFSQVQNVPDGTFNYGGSTTWATIRGSIDFDIQKARPEFRLSYVQQDGVAPSTQSGIELLAQGKVAFSLASRLPSNEVLQRLEKQGVKIRLVPVADSFDAIVVNPSLPISELTLDQIGAIQSGRIENWREVGGSDLLIQKFDRDVNPDMIEGRPDATSRNQVFSTPLEVLRKIADMPGGFAILAAPLAVPQCTVKVMAIVNASGQAITPYKKPLRSPSQCLTQRNQINLAAFESGEYPSDLKNTLYVVIKQNGQIEQQSGEAYANFLLSNEGQALLKKAGYLAVRW